MQTLDVVAAPATSLIQSFRGDFSWLSNFHESPLLWQGLWYPTAEAAFQAGKTLDQNVRQRIADADTPGEAKRLGRAVRLRPDWDRTVCHEVMRDVLAAKFANPTLAADLTATGTALLIEGTTGWCDQKWGCCGCSKHISTPGQNLLGRALMTRRAALAPHLSNRWTRVAGTGHRPHKIPARLRGWVREQLARVAAKLVAEHATEVAISGLAIGTDLWWAQAAHDAGARVWGYSPFPDQDRKWTKPWSDARNEVIANAERLRHLGPPVGAPPAHGEPDNGRARLVTSLLMRRNTWMLRDADALVAVVDSSRTDGGTMAALRQAVGRMPVIRIDLHTEEVRLMPLLRAA